MGKEAEDISAGRSSGGSRLDTPDQMLDPEQYQFLLACSRSGQPARWNRWRSAETTRAVRLCGADLAGCPLAGVDFSSADLSGADLAEADLAGADLAGARLDSASLWMARLDGACLAGARMVGANLRGASLDGASLVSARLDGADLSTARLSGARLTGARLTRAGLGRCDLSGVDLSGADLRGADVSLAVVDGGTLLADCAVDRGTDFSGVGLASARVWPGLRQLLDSNMRRKRWARYCQRGPRLVRTVKTALCVPFWWLSDYGLSTWRVMATFFALAVAFSTVLGAWPQWVTVDVGPPGGVGFLRAVYLTVVTMTSLGLRDVGLRPAAAAGDVLLTVEVLVGYVILAALTARFIIMFTSQGPAGAFALSPDALWRRAAGALLADPRRSRFRIVRTLARRFCEPNRIGRAAMAALLRIRRRWNQRQQSAVENWRPRTMA